MATYSYINNRKKYGRPQAMLFADNPGQIVSATVEDQVVYGYAPLGEEVNAANPGGNFLILSDHGRKDIDFSPTRIENRQRMVNGHMRSYHIADKQTISTSWDRLPSRAFAENPNFDSSGNPGSNITTESSRTIDEQIINRVVERTVTDNMSEQYTVDGGAGGVELKEWYDNNPGSFWVYLAYDNYKNLKNIDPTSDKSWDPYAHMNMYNEVIEVFFSDFSHTVEKRGGLYDFWNVSLSLEEV